MSQVDPRAQAVIDWLLGEARQYKTTADLLTAFSLRLIEAGIPVWRATLHIRQLHPNLFTRMAEWRADKGASELRRPRHLEQTSFFQQSPVALIFDGGPMADYRLAEMSAPRAFEILDELADLGITDYTLWPLPVNEGTPIACSIATRRAGGFTPDDLDLMAPIMRVLAPLVDLLQQRQNAVTLLDTYVGHHTGARILAGDIHLGDGETIPAVLWHCDIRDFTALSESLPRDELIASLNAFFAVMVDAIEEEGGEVLKFIGDGLLAVFRFDADDPDGPCRQALRAAHAACENMKAANDRRSADGMPPIAFGVGLHVGEVMYGNIGGADRLDFTVIGPAVNLVSRVEKMTRQLDRVIVCTKDFVDGHRDAFESLGVHPLRGVEQRVELFAPIFVEPEAVPDGGPPRRG